MTKTLCTTQTSSSANPIVRELQQQQYWLTGRLCSLHNTQDKKTQPKKEISSIQSNNYFVSYFWFLIKKGSPLFEEDLIQSCLDLFTSISWIWYNGVYTLR
jgi:hypothetical protein